MIIPFCGNKIVGSYWNSGRRNSLWGDELEKRREEYVQILGAWLRDGLVKPDIERARLCVVKGGIQDVTEKD